MHCNRKRNHHTGVGGEIMDKIGEKVKSLLTKLYIRLLRRDKEYYSTAIKYKESVYVITVEKYIPNKDFVESLTNFL